MMTDLFVVIASFKLSVLSVRWYFTLYDVMMPLRWLGTISLQENLTDVDETASATKDCGGPPGSANINWLTHWEWNIF